MVDICPFLRTALSVISMSTYKIAKFLVSILTCLTINEFAKEIIEQAISLYMSSPDVDSLITNIYNQFTIPMMLLKV